MAIISIKVTFVVLICMVVVGVPIAQAAITCGQVTGSLAPCIGYLQRGGNPPAACCSGVRALVAATKTTADRKTACNCLKNAIANVPGFNDANAQSLPGKCGVSFPFKFSITTNCANVN